MSSLSAKDRVSLCSFTFSDGRRCRTPRTGKHPRFCFYHAQKEARAPPAQKLGKNPACMRVWSREATGRAVLGFKSPRTRAGGEHTQREARRDGRKERTQR